MVMGHDDGADAEGSSPLPPAVDNLVGVLDFNKAQIDGTVSFEDLFAGNVCTGPATGSLQPFLHARTLRQAFGFPP
jgi:hypothetical protein